MQDNYVSLNPENTDREQKAIRANLYRQRVLDAQGGEGAQMLGFQWGLTASVLTYSQLKGFSMYPFGASKVPGYTKIAGSFLIFYMLGHGYVMSKFGDSKQLRYLYSNKSAIMSGSQPWDRTD